MTPLEIIPDRAEIRLEKVGVAGWRCGKKLPITKARDDRGSDIDGGNGGQERNISNTL